MRYYYILLPCLLLLCGWYRPVGGSCEFESRVGTAQIIVQDGGKTSARFAPVHGDFTAHQIPFSRTTQYAVKQKIQGKGGTLYPAQLAIITKGTCTPYRFSLLATEETSRAIFLQFSKEGQNSPETQHTTNQLIAIFKKLNRYWPDLSVNLCGQAQHDGSREYNLTLGTRYINAIANQLQQTGISAAKIRSISLGEIPCPNSTCFADEIENGVWFSFHLTVESATHAQHEYDFENIIPTQQESQNTDNTAEEN